MEEYVVGKTRDTGFQIGVRKSYPLSLEQAWSLITSPEGIRLWLGESKDFYLAKGRRYQTMDGTSGEVRVVNPQENIRLTWQPKSWGQASTLQIRVIPSGKDKTVIAFHQEKLSGPEEREQMRQHWAAVLDQLLNCPSG